MNLKIECNNQNSKILKDKLKNKKIKQLYERFEKSIDLNERFIVAVSGGPDSL